MRVKRQHHASSDPARRPAGDGRQRWAWAGSAALLLVCGTLGVTLAARLVAQNDRQQAQTTFKAAGAAIASTLTLAIQHEEDLVVSARAYILGNPNGNESAFRRWSMAVDAFGRYRELEGGGELVAVPDSRLADFVARQRSDPAIPLPAGRSFQVLPPGPRPFYCLVALSLSRPGNTANTVPAGFDYCAQPGLRAVFLAARDSGRNGYIPYRSGSGTVLVIETPMYRGGTVPATLAGRRRAFVGTFSVTVTPAKILADALRGHPGMAVDLRYAGASLPVVFRSGSIARGRQQTTISLGYGWTMLASGGPATRSLLGDPSALTLLIGGVAVSVLLGLLLFVLGTSRGRAFAMVREKTREISYQVLHDALTGLPNRTLAVDHGERMLARARRNPEIVPAALYVDVDRFKYVNDTFGHAAGDQMLRTVAQRLSHVVRDEDTVARLGGDEFIVLLESSTREHPPEPVAERVIETMREPVALGPDSRPFAATVSVGIAIGERASADELLRDADLALYTAKACGKDRAVLFEANMKSLADTRRQLELELDEALQQSRFLLLYQPIVDLDEGEIVGAEALIRWLHPQRGLVEPSEFIRFAEETGQIMAIGRWVLKEACRQAAVWAANGHRLGISVNVSAYQLDRDAFCADVRRALDASGIDPHTLTLEITETALMRDVAAASERLRELRELGVRVALDDIGTGTSALAYLRSFSPDTLKIDRSITAGVADAGESAAIIHTLIELGRVLGIETLAEGIEEPEQLEQLQHERCSHGQGFIFAEPVDAGEIERLLARESTHSGAH